MLKLLRPILTATASAEEKHRTRFPPRTDLARQVGLRGEVEQEHPEHVSDLTGAAGASAPVLSPPLAASIF